MESYYKPGSYNVICDRSGFKCKAEDTRMTWDGFRVHKRFWEPRHPQDYLRGVTEDQSVENARPRGDLQFVSGNPEDDY